MNEKECMPQNGTDAHRKYIKWGYVKGTTLPLTRPQCDYICRIGYGVDRQNRFRESTHGQREGFRSRSSEETGHGEACGQVIM